MMRESSLRGHIVLNRLVRASGIVLGAISLTGCVYTTSFTEIRENWFSNAEAEQTATPAESAVQDEALGPVEGEVLALELDSLTDEDGVGGLTYRWEMETQPGVWLPIEGEVASSMMPTQAHVGRPLRVVIRYIDGGGTEEVIVSEPTAPVRNVNNAPGSVPLLNGVARQHETLYFDASGLTDEDGLGPLQFSWEASTDQQTWTQIAAQNSHLLRLDQSLVGKSVRGVISYTDAFGQFEEVHVGPSSRVADVDDPVEGNPVLMGQTQKGQVLSLDLSDIRDDDGIADLLVTWEASSDGMKWRDLGSNSTYQVALTQSLVNHVLRARVVVTDRLGNATELLSPVSAQVQNVNSAPRGVIRIVQ